MGNQVDACRGKSSTSDTKGKYLLANIQYFVFADLRLLKSGRFC